MNDLKNALQILGSTAKLLRSILSDSPEEWAKIDEGENTWSPAMVLCHLIRGDKAYWIENFRVILEQRPYAFAPFPKKGQFDDVDIYSLNELISQFTSIRENNIKEILEASLSRVDLSLIGNHANLGRVKLNELISAWAVHDLGHIIQISRVIAKNLRSKVGPWEPYLSVLHTK